MIREPVNATPRTSISFSRKQRIHTLREGKCWMCGKPVLIAGPEVRYDHRVPLELGGSDGDENLWPLHTDPCDKLKTKADVARIAKARRLRIKSNPETRKAKRPIVSRGFDKSKRRKFDGSIEERK